MSSSLPRLSTPSAVMGIVCSSVAALPRHRVPDSGSAPPGSALRSLTSHTTTSDRDVENTSTARGTPTVAAGWLIGRSICVCDSARMSWPGRRMDDELGLLLPSPTLLVLEPGGPVDDSDELAGSYVDDAAVGVVPLGWKMIVEHT